MFSKSAGKKKSKQVATTGGVVGGGAGIAGLAGAGVLMGVV